MPSNHDILMAMCLVVLSLNQSVEAPFLLAANRDEFFARPADTARWWATKPGLLAGRDLERGGTWFAATDDGRFALVTNIRRGKAAAGTLRSRGDIPLRLLDPAADMRENLRRLLAESGEYQGFNVLAGAVNGPVYFASAELNEPLLLQPGLYGLSNAGLDTPWPKVVRVKEQLGQLIAADQATDDRVRELLHDPQLAPDVELPSTGVPLEWERALSAACISAPQHGYGTRCTTILRVEAGRDRSIVFREWTRETIMVPFHETAMQRWNLPENNLRSRAELPSPGSPCLS